MDLHKFFLPDSTITGVKGLVLIGGKLLVYRRDQQAPQFPGYLDLPGGGSEADETPFETFRREVKEEFNLDIQSDNISFAERRSKKDDPGKAVYFAVAELTKSAADEITLGDEGTEYFILEKEDFLSRGDVWPYFQSRTREYYDEVKHPSGM
jgi:8-oxo-dGTP diphosphatase